MNVPSNPYRCPVGQLQSAPMDVDAVKRDGWIEQHILVVDEGDERLNTLERALVRRLGERLYGNAGSRHA